MREDQHGKYYGVGMQIQPQGTKIVVLAPFEGTPAYKAGIRPGDVILSVDGKSTDNMDSTAVASHAEGTARDPRLGHDGARRLAQAADVFDLMRDEIPRYSVDLAFLIRPGIGYIHVTNSWRRPRAKCRTRWTSSARHPRPADRPARQPRRPAERSRQHVATSSCRRDRSSSRSMDAPSPTRCIARRTARTRSTRSSCW